MAKALDTLTEVELIAELLKADSNVEEVRARMKPLEARLHRSVDRRDKVRDALATLKADDIGYIIKDVNAWDQWRKLCPKQTYPNGYWADTNEQAFKIMLDYREEASEEMIAFVVKYAAVATVARMGVFRWDLAERGMWNVELVDGIWRCYDATGYDFQYQHKYEFETNDLREMLKYVAENHYYQGGPANDRDRDDDQY